MGGFEEFTDGERTMTNLGLHEEGKRRAAGKRVGRAVLVGTFVAVWSAHDQGIVLSQQRAPTTVTRLYTGPDGQTHAEEINVKLAPSALQDGTARSDVKVTNMRFVRWPPGHVNDWHNAGEVGGRQYVITISGRGEVELADGKRISLEPGRVLLGEDLTGKGHLTRTAGSNDWVSVHVYVADQ
jgi:hypothetical protein